MTRTIPDKTAPDKAAFRKSAFARRKTAFGQGLDAAANRHLLTHIMQYPDARIVSAYMPIRTEISPIRAMTELHRQGVRICVPVIQGTAQPLLFQEWTPDCEMIAGPFGAAVPANGAFLTPDIVITPLLAFDRRGYRLGYGGGFYDRTFELLRAKAEVLGVGFAYSVQEVDCVPTEPTDQVLDAIITEKGPLALAGHDA